MTEAVSTWLRGLAAEGRIVAGGYFGSYARGDAGVGSDLDVVLVTSDTKRTVDFEHRSVAFDATDLPVPVDLLVYTEAEMRALLDKRNRFSGTLQTEAVWVVPLPAIGD